VIAAMQQRAPVYKDYFPQWSAHSIGMVQYIIWTALEKEGLGASLQVSNSLPCMCFLD
jgi:predicted oxidoreductase (fatty acid repression mutant protein)